MRFLKKKRRGLLVASRKRNKKEAKVWGDRQLGSLYMGNMLEGLVGVISFRRAGNRGRTTISGCASREYQLRVRNLKNAALDLVRSLLIL